MNILVEMHVCVAMRLQLVEYCFNNLSICCRHCSLPREYIANEHGHNNNVNFRKIMLNGSSTFRMRRCHHLHNGIRYRCPSNDFRGCSYPKKVKRLSQILRFVGNTVDWRRRQIRLNSRQLQRLLKIYLESQFFQKYLHIIERQIFAVINVELEEDQ